MPSFASITVLTAFAASVLASPTPQATPEVNVNAVPFRINQVGRGQVLKNGPLQVAKAYAKFGKAVPANVDAAAKAQQSGSVVASPEAYDMSYLSPVSLGTPPTTLMLDFDTGSSDLWVFSSELSAAVRSGHDYYSPGKSSTSKAQSGQSWSISYGDGSGASGNVYADTVTIGSVTATGQAIEAASSISAQFVQDVNNDGLVGLAWPKINTCSPKRCQTFVQTVKSTLPGKLFTADLQHSAPGSYDFGFINETKYSGSISYAKVTKANGFWEFTASGYAIGGTPYTSDFDTIADTGTTLMYLPNRVISAYYKLVSGSQNSASQGGYIFPCNATLPDFGVTVSGTTFTVPGSYINYAPVDATTCFGGLQSSDGVGINILGDMFLKSVFAVFDVANVRVGFAQKA